MTDKELALIEYRLKQAKAAMKAAGKSHAFSLLSRTIWGKPGQEGFCGCGTCELEIMAHKDVPALLAEVKRLRRLVWKK